MQLLRIGIIGVGGYARTHLEYLKSLEKRGECRLEAAVIHLPGHFEAEEAELRAGGTRIHRTIDALCAEESGRLDLLIIPTGIPLHAPMSIAALRAGFNVLCEKPTAGTVAEVDEMIRTEAECGRFLAIGYQHVYSPIMQALKRLALSGCLGRLIEAKSSALWPRGRSYYERNDWAGRLRAGGKLINDSPLQNALAHYLNNLLFVAGPSLLESARPLMIWGENCRAKPIESADTQFLRVIDERGTRIEFWATHACAHRRDPIAEYVFEGGRVGWDMNDRLTLSLDRAAGEVAEILRGAREGEDIREAMYADLFAAVRTGSPPACPVAATRAHVECVETLFSRPPMVVEQRYTRWIQSEDGSTPAIDSIEEDLERAYREGLSFSELGLPWAPGLARFK